MIETTFVTFWRALQRERAAPVTGREAWSAWLATVKVTS